MADRQPASQQPTDTQVVGVLGSARIPAGDPRYEDAIGVGRHLVEAGFAVMTGGYGGLMEAVSRGAREAGGAVIGLPVRRWPGLTPNPWITDLIWTESFTGRLPHLASCDALVALDGGIGTLAELAVAWADRQTDPDVTPPLVLVGAGWRAILDTVEQALVVGARDLALVRWVSRPEDVVGAVLGLLDGPVPAAEPRG